MSRITDTLDSLSIDKVVLSTTIALDLVGAITEILQLLQKGDEMDEIELIKLIEKYDTAKDTARNALIESIQRRKASETT